MSKNLLAFLLGGLVVGGVVFFVARRGGAPTTPSPSAEQTQAVAAPAPASTPEPASANAAAPAPSAPSAPRETSAQATSRTPVHHEKMAQSPARPANDAAPAQVQQVAQAAPPAPEPAPAMAAPMPQPVAAPKRAEPAPILQPDRVVENANRTPHSVTIPAGTILTVRLREAIDTSKQSKDDPFTATLDVPLVIDGFIIAEKGSTVRGKITELVHAGRASTRASRLAGAEPDQH